MASAAMAESIGDIGIPFKRRDGDLTSRIIDWVTWIVPQDASGDLKLSPMTSKLCDVCTFVCLALALLVHIFCDYAAVRQPIQASEDPYIQRYFHTAAMLSLGGLVYEVCIKAAISAMGMLKAYQEDLLLRIRLRLNMKMICAFSILTTVYHCMAFNKHWVHVGWLAEQYGGDQAVYSFRYIEWVCCSPFVFSICGQLPFTPDGKPRNGCISSGLLTGAYCIISWQGLVVKDLVVAWLCIAFAFLCYFLASVEQLLVAWYLKDLGRSGPLRAGLLTYLVVMCGVYGVVYLLPIPGCITASLEQKFYCICDCSFKLGTSIVLISTYDLSCNEELRRHAEAAADDLLELIDTASVPIFGVDLNWRIDLWNQKVAALTGLSPERAMGRPFLDMLSTHKRAEAIELLRQASGGMSSIVLETTLMAQDSGPQAMLILSATARCDKTGRVRGVTLVGCDLTQVETFREAEIRKTRFMAVVSHELRSPLHGIVGLAGRLLEKEMDPSKARRLQMVGSCASRLLDLVVNIMEMARLVQKDGQGKNKTLQMQCERVELAKVIEEVVTLTRSSVDKSGNALLKPGVELINETQDLPVIEADGHRCTQVFFNLVTNAVKFTTEGSVRISSRGDPNGRWVEVLVSDTGPGIPSSAVDRIFLPFEQEDNSDARHFEGVGLGLSIASEVVRLHGGRIEVSSERGAGTTFRVKLPTVMGESLREDQATEPSDRASPLQWKSEAEATVLTSAQSGLRQRRRVARDKPLVLSVNDDEVEQRMIQSILQADYDVHMVMDGRAAVERLRSCGAELPDCVVLDALMPGLSGFEVCRTIRKQLRLDGTALPVLMLATSSSPEAASKCFDCGCNDYVTKPFHRQVLRAHVAAAVVQPQGGGLHD